MTDIPESSEWVIDGKKYEIKRSQQGHEAYFCDGELHRSDGPALILPSGSEWWWLNGEVHRADGPAIIRADGSQDWYREGKRHRLDGPARIYYGGYHGWWVDGKEISIRETLGEDYPSIPLSPEKQNILKTQPKGFPPYSKV